MALLTIACVASAIEFLWNGEGQILWFALIFLVIGSALTCVRRLTAAYHQLNERS